MRDLLEYIIEAASNNDNKAFFKDFKGLRKIGSYGKKWYEEVNTWVKKYNLTLLPEGKMEKPNNQPLLTVLLSKKEENLVLDIAVTKPGKKYEIEGAASINLTANPIAYLSSISDYEKWYKSYRGIRKLQYTFPDNFFNNVRAFLADKLC